MGGGRRGSGGKIAIGGGAGLIVLILALLFGINPGDVLGGAPQAGPEQSDNPSQFAQCTQGADINTDRDCRFVAYTNSIQDYWTDSLQGYQEIQVVTFTGSVNTACGNARFRSRTVLLSSRHDGLSRSWILRSADRPARSARWRRR